MLTDVLRCLRLRLEFWPSFDEWLSAIINILKILQNITNYCKHTAFKTISIVLDMIIAIMIAVLSVMNMLPSNASTPPIIYAVTTSIRISITLVITSRMKIIFLAFPPTLNYQKELDIPWIRKQLQKCIALLYHAQFSALCIMFSPKRVGSYFYKRAKHFALIRH